MKFSNDTINFLIDLRMNNNKPWFLDSKERFETTLNEPMKELALAVFDKLSELYPDKKFSYRVSRIYKDARSIPSNDYCRTNLWFFIEKSGENFRTAPGFWFEIGIDKWSYGMGYYQAKPTAMAKFRARLDSNPEVFKKLIHEANDMFVVTGKKYIRKKDSPVGLEEWYNLKNFSIGYYSDKHSETFSDGLFDRLIKDFTGLMALYEYFDSLEIEA